jgi:hypothetical protein
MAIAGAVVIAMAHQQNIETIRFWHVVVNFISARWVVFVCSLRRVGKVRAAQSGLGISSHWWHNSKNSLVGQIMTNKS